VNLNKNKKTLQLFAHLAGWVVFFGLMFIGKGMLLKIPFLFACHILLIVGYFYLNTNVLVPSLLSKKKVLGFIGITLLCFFLLGFVLPSLVHLFNDFAPPLDMPFPQRPFDGFPPSDNSSLSSLISRWQFYGMRLYNPVTQFLLVFIISTGLKVLTQWYQGQQQLKDLEKLKIQAELSFLKSQIHPHFLFNCLNSIYYITLIKDDKAPKTVLSLSDFLRFVIIESDSNYIPMEKEIKMLEEYLELQSLRTSEKFELQFNKDGSFEEHSIMPLTFIPFVENAFKYGISAHVHCFIHIKIEMDNGTLKFTCDNSIMTTVKDNTRSSGIGLDNIRKRLELAYPNRYSLEIGEDSSAFHVKLHINIV
jgi:hypothetical protein